MSRFRVRGPSIPKPPGTKPPVESAPVPTVTEAPPLTPSAVPSGPQGGIPVQDFEELESLRQELEARLSGEEDPVRYQNTMDRVRTTLDTPPPWETVPPEMQAQGVPAIPREPAPQELTAHVATVKANLRALRDLMSADPTTLTTMLGTNPLAVIGRSEFLAASKPIADNASWAHGISLEAERLGISMEDLLTEIPPPSDDPGVTAFRLKTMAEKVLEKDPNAAVGPPKDVLDVSDDMRKMRPVQFPSPVAPPPQTSSLEDAPANEHWEANPKGSSLTTRRIVNDLTAGEDTPLFSLVASKPDNLEDLSPTIVPVRADKEGRLVATLPSPSSLEDGLEIEVTNSLAPLGLDASGDWKIQHTALTPVKWKLDPESERLLIDRDATATRGDLHKLLKENKVNNLTDGVTDRSDDPLEYLKSIYNRTFKTVDEAKEVLQKIDGISSDIRSRASSIPNMAEQIAMPGSPEWFKRVEEAKLLREKALLSATVEHAKARVLEKKAGLRRRAQPLALESRWTDPDELVNRIANKLENNHALLEEEMDFLRKNTDLFPWALRKNLWKNPEVLSKDPETAARAQKYIKGRPDRWVAGDVHRIGKDPRITKQFRDPDALESKIYDPPPEDPGLNEEALFHSKLLRLLSKQKQRRWDAKSLAGMINNSGIKQNEKTVLGLVDYLSKNPKVDLDDMISTLAERWVEFDIKVLGEAESVGEARPESIEFIDQNGNTISDYDPTSPEGEHRVFTANYTYEAIEELGGDPDRLPNVVVILSSPGGWHLPIRAELTIQYPDDPHSHQASFTDRNSGVLSELVRNEVAEYLGLQKRIDRSIYGPSSHYNVVLPGGVPGTYKEVIFHYKPKYPSPEFQRFTDTGQGLHFRGDEQAFHARFDTFLVGDKKYLRVQEIQSDWGIIGRRQGMTQDIEKPYEVIKVIPGERAQVIETFKSPEEADERVKALTKEEKLNTVESIRRGRGTRKQREALLRIASPHRYDTTAYRSRRYEPPIGWHPFTQTWPEVAAKFLYRYARDNNFNGVMWTTGRQQAIRYGLDVMPEDLIIHKPRDISLVPEDHVLMRVSTGGSAFIEGAEPGAELDMQDFAGYEAVTLTDPRKGAYSDRPYVRYAIPLKDLEKLFGPTTAREVARVWRSLDPGARMNVTPTGETPLQKAWPRSLYDKRLKKAFEKINKRELGGKGDIKRTEGAIPDYPYASRYAEGTGTIWTLSFPKDMREARSQALFSDARWEDPETGEVRVFADWDIELVEAMGFKMYSNKMLVTMTKEAMQDALDAVKMRSDEDPAFVGKITIAYDAEKNTLRISDDGIGMSLEIATTYAMDIGKSLKRLMKQQGLNKNTTGELGLGKIVQYLGTDMSKLITCDGVTLTEISGSGRQWVTTPKRTKEGEKPGLTLNSRTIPPEGIEDSLGNLWRPGDRGTIKDLKIRESLKEEWNFDMRDQYRWGADDFLKDTIKYNTSPHSIEVTTHLPRWGGDTETTMWPTERFTKIDVPTAPSDPSIAEMQPLGSLIAPGFEADIYVSKDFTESDRLSLALLNNGYYQGHASQGTDWGDFAKLPTITAIDIRATVTAEDIKYPWTANREGINEQAGQLIAEHLKTHLVDSLIREKKAIFTEALRGGPEIPALPTNAIKQTVMDPTGTIPQEELQTFSEDVDVRLSHLEISKAVDFIKPLISKILEGVSKVEFGGLVVQENVAGKWVNASSLLPHTPDGPHPNMFFISPTAIARAIEVRAELWDSKTADDTEAMERLASGLPEEEKKRFLNLIRIGLDKYQVAARMILSTITHEIVHEIHRNHGEQFSATLEDMVTTLSSHPEWQRIANRIAVMLGENNGQRFQKLARLENEILSKREGDVDDLLESISVSSRKGESDPGAEGLGAIGRRGPPERSGEDIRHEGVSPEESGTLPTREQTPESLRADKRAEALAHLASGQGWSKHPKLFEVLSDQEKFEAMKVRLVGPLTAKAEVGKQYQWAALNPAKWESTGKYPKYFGDWKPTPNQMAELKEIYRAQHVRRGYAIKVDRALDSRMEDPVDIALDELLATSPEQLDDWALNNPKKHDAWVRSFMQISKNLTPQQQEAMKKLGDVRDLYSNSMDVRQSSYRHPLDEIEDERFNYLKRVIEGGKQLHGSIGSFMDFIDRPYGVLGPRAQAPHPKEQLEDMRSGKWDRSVFKIGYQGDLKSHQQKSRNFNETEAYFKLASQKRNKHLDNAIYLALTTNVSERELRNDPRWTIKVHGRKEPVKLSQFIPKLRRLYADSIKEAYKGRREALDLFRVGNQAAILFIEAEMKELEALHSQSPEFKRLKKMKKASVRKFREVIQEIKTLESSKETLLENPLRAAYTLTRDHLLQDLRDPYSMVSSSLHPRLAKGLFDAAEKGPLAETEDIPQPFQSWATSWALQVPLMGKISHLEPALFRIARKLNTLPEDQRVYTQSWMGTLQGSQNVADVQLSRMHLFRALKTGVYEDVINALQRDPETPEEIVAMARKMGTIREGGPRKLARTMAWTMYLSLLMPVKVGMLNITEFGFLVGEMMKKSNDLAPKKNILGVNTPIVTMGMQYILPAMARAGSEGVRELLSWIQQKGGSMTPRFMSEATQQGVIDIVHEALRTDLDPAKELYDPLMSKAVKALTDLWFPVIRATEYFLRASAYYALKKRGMYHGMTEEEAMEIAGMQSVDLISGYGPRDVSPLAQGFPWDMWWPLNRFVAGKFTLLRTAASGSVKLLGGGALKAIGVEREKPSEAEGNPLPPFVPGSKYNFVGHPDWEEGTTPYDHFKDTYVPPPNPPNPPKPPKPPGPGSPPAPEDRPDDSDWRLLTEYQSAAAQYGNSQPASPNAMLRQLITLTLGTSTAMGTIWALANLMSAGVGTWVEINKWMSLNPYNISNFSNVNTLFWLEPTQDFYWLSTKALLFGNLTIGEAKKLEEAKRDLVTGIPLFGQMLSFAGQMARKKGQKAYERFPRSSDLLRDALHVDKRVYRELSKAQRRKSGKDNPYDVLFRGKVAPFGIESAPYGLLPEAGKWFIEHAVPGSEHLIGDPPDPEDPEERSPLSD